MPSVFQLPPYAPDLNPVESIWSVLRRITTASRAFADPDDLITAVRCGVRQLQYRLDVFDGCLTGTGLLASHRDDITHSRSVDVVQLATERAVEQERPRAMRGA
ncbi:transposase [Streptomyces sp. NPDC093509]|uniref:transposase n=1 Tax=Streptomyces sp. NPDC093509 TaxID=3154982 RepID=UPI00344D4A41